MLGRPVSRNQNQYPSVPSGASAIGHLSRRGALHAMIASGTAAKVPGDRASPAAKAHADADTQRSSRARTTDQTINATARASAYPAKKTKLAGHVAASISVRIGRVLGNSLCARRSSPQK